MMKKAVSAWILFLGLAMVLSAADEIKKTAETNRLLNAEASLAKAASSYVVMDFGEKTVTLKARGVVLKKWEVRKTKFWGNAVSIKSIKLLKKSAWFPPKRKNIVPGKDEQGNIDLGVLELKDMPKVYSLTFPDRVHISVRPKSRNFFLFFRNAGNVLRRFLYLPLKTIWFSMRKKDFTEIELVMVSEKDAKALYWAFSEGQNFIVYRPSK